MLHKHLDNLDFYNKRIPILGETEIKKETIPLLRYDEYPKTYKVVSYWSWFKTKRKVVELKKKEYFTSTIIHF